MASVLSGCKADDIWMPFSDYSETVRLNRERSPIISHSGADDRYESFASDLCVYTDNVSVPDYSTISSNSAVLIDAG